MPVRSLTSSVLKWPSEAEVVEALTRWAPKVAGDNRDVVRIGYFGSYARGNWGVGSDLDVLVIVGQTDVSYLERARRFDATSLPVPADVFVYTKDEWESGVFHPAGIEARWVYERA